MIRRKGPKVRDTQTEIWIFEDGDIEVTILNGEIVIARLLGTDLHWNWLIGQFDMRPTPVTYQMSLQSKRRK
jgi:hypothetical protein